MYSNITVDCIGGNDNENSKNFKTLDYCMEKINSGNSVFILPGAYPGLNVESIESIFEYTLEGTGIDVELFEVTHKGKINAKYKKMKMREIRIEGIGNALDFREVDFSHNHEFFCIQNNNNNNNTCNIQDDLTFIDCTFGINYQLIVKTGNYNITFRNCIFRGKRKIPIIVAKQSKVKLNVTLCDFDVPLIHNENSLVNIQHCNCNFTQLWSGMQCYVRNNQKTKIVDSNKYCRIKISHSVEFLVIRGKFSITIDLPDIDKIQDGHIIEILNQCPVVKINGRKYYKNIIKIRLVENCWFIY